MTAKCKTDDSLEIVIDAIHRHCADCAYCFDGRPRCDALTCSLAPYRPHPQIVREIEARPIPIWESEQDTIKADGE